MKIMAVENIPYVEQAFAAIGEVTVIPDKQLSPGTVRDADILLVRSTVPITAELLTNSRVKFVGTATIGYDHVDLDYLAAHKITFASAPGSNSNSVSEYITTALLELAHKHGFNLRDKVLGVIGVGQVGSKVVKKAKALGMTVVQNDPPLARRTGNPVFRCLDEIFLADIITTHVPLTKEGDDRTHHLVDDSFFKRMKPGAIYINSSRGSVLDTTAAHRALAHGKLASVVFDVWEKEPTIDLNLLDKAFIGTPHIAGHSFDGKVNGTQMLYNAVCAFLGTAPAWDPAPLLPPALCPEIIITDDQGQATLRSTVRTLYDIFRDDADLRKITALPLPEQGPYFSRLRKNYPVRREFHYTTVKLSPAAAGLKNTLAGLGFNVIINPA
jgi:erythronate-4-phosphate dehydrogenase